MGLGVTVDGFFVLRGGDGGWGGGGGAGGAGGNGGPAFGGGLYAASGQLAICGGSVSGTLRRGTAAAAPMAPAAATPGTAATAAKRITSTGARVATAPTERRDHGARSRGLARRRRRVRAAPAGAGGAAAPVAMPMEAASTSGARPILLGTSVTGSAQAGSGATGGSGGGAGGAGAAGQGGVNGGWQVGLEGSDALRAMQGTQARPVPTARPMGRTPTAQSRRPLPSPPRRSHSPPPRPRPLPAARCPIQSMPWLSTPAARSIRRSTACSSPASRAAELGPDRHPQRRRLGRRRRV